MAVLFISCSHSDTKTYKIKNLKTRIISNYQASHPGFPVTLLWVLCPNDTFCMHSHYPSLLFPQEFQLYHLLSWYNIRSKGSRRSQEGQGRKKSGRSRCLHASSSWDTGIGPFLIVDHVSVDSQEIFTTFQTPAYHAYLSPYIILEAWQRPSQNSSKEERKVLSAVGRRAQESSERDGEVPRADAEPCSSEGSALLTALRRNPRNSRITDFEVGKNLRKIYW